MRVDPEKDMRVETHRTQARHDIARADPLVVLAAPPCSVFSSMRNINQKHHGTPEWEKKYEDGSPVYNSQWMCVGIRFLEGICFFMNTLPLRLRPYCVREIAEHPGVSIVTGDMCRWGMYLPEESDNQGTEHSVLVKTPTKWMHQDIQLHW